MRGRRRADQCPLRPRLETLLERRDRRHAGRRCGLPETGRIHVPRQHLLTERDEVPAVSLPDRARADDEEARHRSLSFWSVATAPRSVSVNPAFLKAESEAG